MVKFQPSKLAMRVRFPLPAIRFLSVNAAKQKTQNREQHVITVTGKVFYDVARAPANHSNRRSTPKDYVV
jgi:hypothetical protein